MKPVRWGILGVSGHYTLRISVPLRSSQVVELAGIASRTEARAKEAAAALGIAQGYGSYESMLKDPSIEAIYIPLPNHMHLDWIKRCADNGKHVLCEKPLGLDAEQVEEAIDYTEKKGVRLMEAFMYRFHPQWVRARELVQCGEIGRVTAIQTSFFYNNTDPQNIRNRLEYGGGSVLDIGCYAVSSARFLLGKEPKRVVSLVQRDQQFGTDRLVSAVMDFGDVQANWSVGTQTYGQQRVQVFGTGGSIVVELPFNAFPDVPLSVHVRTGVDIRTVACGPADQYLLQFEAFSRAIREGASVPTPAADALANQRVLDAVFRSEQSGAWETV